ncbi:hypothetical protein TSOC_004961 [Tetrabaena socialis]|uniref:Uncharacterized protein n=1 Tax=Tetrabaena socialis TaxID=47790 RepID=A0A2J8A7J6_9CHLO|nr:hypothetical protein TSOC_004961 [Tetrabaena socialis]|eukprot:PNH08488.1 hypothetical protein TSOC_004961 [Tetrabaena socialis]
MPEGFTAKQPGSRGGRSLWEASRMKPPLINPPFNSRSFTYGSALGEREAKLKEVQEWFAAGRPTGPWPVSYNSCFNGDIVKGPFGGR